MVDTVTIQECCLKATLWLIRITDGYMALQHGPSPAIVGGAPRFLLHDLLNPGLPGPTGTQ